MLCGWTYVALLTKHYEVPLGHLKAVEMKDIYHDPSLAEPVYSANHL